MSQTYDELLASLSPVAWWKLADAVGAGTAKDSSGNGYDGTVNGTVTFGEAGPLSGTPADTGALFGGGYAITASAPDVSGAYSILAWVKNPSSAGTQDLISSRYPSDYGTALRYTGTGLSLIVGTGSAWIELSFSHTIDLADGAWHFVAATITTTGAEMFVDGASVATTTWASATPLMSDSSHLLELGGYDLGNEELLGSLAQVAVVGSALTSTQIADLYAAASVLDLPNAPSAVSAQASNSGAINLSWTPGTAVPDAVTEYQVATYQSGIGKIDETTVAGNVTTLSVSGLPAGSTFWFTVTAVNQVGSSSATESNQTSPVYVPPVYGGGDTYSPFTYVLTDLRSGAYKGSIPLTGVTFSKVLNGNGQFTGTCDLMDPLFQVLDPNSLTSPGSTALFVDYNGALVAGYVLGAPRGYDVAPGKHTLTVSGADIWAWFAQRTQATDYSSPPYSGITGPGTPMPIWNAANQSQGGVPVGWDPMLMAWQVISDALSIEPPYSNILGGLSIAANGFISTSDYLASGSGTPVGDYTAQSYPFSSLQTIDTIVNQLTQLGYGVGFDRGVDVAYSNGPLSVPIATVNLSYPRRGRTVAENNLVCDMRSARKYSLPYDPSQMANTAYETGPSGAIAALQNINPLQQGYPIYEKVYSRSQITSAYLAQLLYQIGLSDLALDSYPVTVPQITMPLFGQNPTFGSFVEGDDMLVVLPATDWQGNAWDPMYPGGFAVELRLQQYTVTVADSGDSVMDLVFNAPPIAQATGPVLP